MSKERAGVDAPGGVKRPRWRRGKTPEAPVVTGPFATPLLRRARGEPLEPCEWGTALAAFCDGFRRVQEARGRSAAGWTVSENLTNEELAFIASLARDGLGFAPAAQGAAPLLSPAWEAPEESDVIVVFGSTVTAPESPLWQRLSCNRHQPRLIAVAGGDAAPGETARYSPQPGSALTLLYGLANIIIAGGWLDRTFIEQRTADYADFAALVAHYTTDRVCTETGLEAECVWDLAQTIGTGARVCFCGEPETSPRAESALRNLALLTGQWGRPGTGLCLGMEPSNALGAYRFGQTGSLARCAAAANSGGLKALWVVASDTPVSSQDVGRLADLAAQLDWLVVQGGSPAGLAQAADLYLPTAGWRAKEGTRLDPSGQLRLLKPRLQALGGGMTDFHLFKLIAQYWGCGALFSRWSSPESAFQVLKETTRGGPHDFSGVPDYSDIDAYRPAFEPAGATRLPFLFD